MVSLQFGFRFFFLDSCEYEHPNGNKPLEKKQCSFFLFEVLAGTGDSAVCHLVPGCDASCPFSLLRVIQELPDVVVVIGVEVVECLGLLCRRNEGLTGCCG